VATLFLGFFIVGWRAVFMLIERRRTDVPRAAPQT
jgi:hypothetical protein